MPVVLKPAPTPPGAAAVEEESWDALVATQLADARKSAENWRNGLIAMLALVTGFSVIKGPSDVSGLDAPFAQAVGALLLVAFVAALYGSWTSLDAAYGTPKVVARGEVEKLGITGYRLNLASDAADKLGRAKAAMLLSSLFLAAALGTTWYGPRSAAPVLRVERSSAPPVCGKFVSSSGAAFDLQPPNAGIVRIPLKDVKKLSVGAACP